MQSSESTPTESDAEPLRPLTKRTTEGNIYTREAKHERHIRQALSIPVHRFEEWIRSFDYGEKRYAELSEDAPSPEALVYLYRHYLAEAERFNRERRARAFAGANEILRALLEGIQAAIASHLPGKLRGVPKNRKATCVAEVESDVIARLHDPGDAADPLEVAFGLILKRLCAKVARQYRNRARTEEAVTTDGLPDSEVDTLDPARLLDSERAKQAVERLPPAQKTVVKRRLLQDPPTPQADLAHEEGVSVRTIRNRQRAAEDNLRAFLGEDK